MTEERKKESLAESEPKRWPMPQDMEECATMLEKIARESPNKRNRRTAERLLKKMGCDKASLDKNTELK